MGFFFLFIKKKKKKEEEEERGSAIHIVWKKKSHELVLCHSLMVDDFHGSKSSFFFVSLFFSLSYCMCFLGSKLNLVWHSHVRYWWSNKGLGMGFGFALKYENGEDWAWMCIYMNESTVLLSLLLLLLCCCYAMLARWANLHARR